ncbi:MAG: SRPBCC domain-containing protein [Acetobacteraceae bacterium]|nr:SRPBCC domain-containing protein [Acetobacteraceae bacterium]
MTLQQPPPLRPSRVLHAPRKTVFEGWGSADHVRRWFSPETFTVSEATMQMRVGGPFEVCMRSPAAEAHWIRGTFIEVAPYITLVTHMHVTDGAGKSYSAPIPNSPSPTRSAGRTWTWCKHTRSLIHRWRACWPGRRR